MKLLRHGLIALVAGLAATALAATDEPTPPEPTPEESAALREAQVLGRLMFQHDRAAWVGTDLARELRAFRKDKRVRGYVTIPVADSIRVIFFGEGATPGARAALYRVDVGPDFKPLAPAEAFKEPRPLEAFEQAVVAARDLAMQQQFSLCGSSYNTIVLPTGGDGAQTWTVYLMPAQTQAGFQIGGVHRLRVSGAGDKVLDRRTFTRSCIELPADRKAVALTVSHLMDPVPTEVHVFTSLAAGKPLFVLTTPSEAAWAVEGDRIRLIQRNLGQAP